MISSSLCHATYSTYSTGRLRPPGASSKGIRRNRQAIWRTRSGPGRSRRESCSIHLVGQADALGHSAAAALRRILPSASSGTSCAPARGPLAPQALRQRRCIDPPRTEAAAVGFHAHPGRPLHLLGWGPQPLLAQDLPRAAMASDSHGATSVSTTRRLEEDQAGLLVRPGLRGPVSVPPVSVWREPLRRSGRRQARYGQSRQHGRGPLRDLVMGAYPHRSWR